jgi:hypothetical protein
MVYNQKDSVMAVVWKYQNLIESYEIHTTLQKIIKNLELQRWKFRYLLYQVTYLPLKLINTLVK